MKLNLNNADVTYEYLVNLRMAMRLKSLLKRHDLSLDLDILRFLYHRRGLVANHFLLKVV